MEQATAVAIFTSLSSPVRLQVFRLLLEHEPRGLVAGEIADQLGLPPANLSFHLKTLTHVGLVLNTQYGRFQRYRAHVEMMQQLIAYMTGLCCAEHPEQCPVSEGMRGNPSWRVKARNAAE